MATKSIRWPCPVRDYKKMPSKKVKARLMELFDTASQIAKKDLLLALRYTKRARQISLATRVRIPLELRRRICKECSSYLVSGKNATIRTQRGNVVITCKSCKTMFRIPYTKKE